jgi:hypothetical protein
MFRRHCNCAKCQWPPVDVTLHPRRQEIQFLHWKDLTCWCYKNETMYLLLGVGLILSYYNVIMFSLGIVYTGIWSPYTSSAKCKYINIFFTFIYCLTLRLGKFPNHTVHHPLIFTGTTPYQHNKVRRRQNSTLIYKESPELLLLES